MASPLRQFRFQQPNTLAVDAPVGGWNARDSLDSMDATDAVVMDNWVPGFSEVYVRPGFRQFTTGLGAAVEALMVYDNATDLHMLGAAGANIYRVDGGGAVGAALITGQLNAQWQWDMFFGELIMVNGADTPLSYNGTTIATKTLTGPADPKVLKGCITHNSRMYFWENNSSQFWYSGTGALGTITAFDLNTVSQRGGIIVNMVSWTRESVGGLTNYLVILMSSGLAIVYSGSDPGDPANWALRGTFDVGLAVGPRSALKVGADAVIITSDGYQPISTALQGGRSSTRFNVSDKIQQAASEAIFNSGGNFGWDIEFYPLRNWLVVNYPVGSGVYEQHVANLRTGAWCRFKGVNAQTWRLFGERLYFGGEGIVYLFDDSANDDGNNILADCITAFNYLGSRSRRKQVNNLRILASSDGDLPLEVQVGVDLDINIPPGVITNFIASAVGTAEWDKATWDVDSWAGITVATDKWLDRGNLGYSFATRVRYNGQGREVRWGNHTYSFDYVNAL